LISVTTHERLGTRSHRKADTTVQYKILARHLK
jgi:hypothetical protein